MPKPKDSDCDKRCAVCSLCVKSEGVPFRGVKDKKPKILTLLELLLPHQDFILLCDEKFFPDPQLCTSCYDKLMKIPTTVLTLQNLLGKSLNIQLYKPSRQAWEGPADLKRNLLAEDSEKCTFRHTEGVKFQSKYPYDQAQNGSQCSLVRNVEDEGTVFFSFEDIEREDLHQNLKDVAQTGEKLNGTRDTILLSSGNAEMSNDLNDNGEISNCLKTTTSEKRLHFNEKLLEALSHPDMFSKESDFPEKQATSSRQRARDFPLKKSRAHQKGVVTSRRCASLSENKGTQQEAVAVVRPKRTCVKPTQTKDFSTRASAVNETKTDMTNGEQSLEFYHISDISVSESEDEYTPPSLKAAGNKAKYFKYNIRSEKVSKSTGELGSHLSQVTPKSVLKEKEAKNKSTKSAEKPKSEPVMIQCIEKGCCETYSSWNQLAQHLKYSHFGGALPDSGESWLKLSMLVENRKVNGEAYVHECTQDGCGLTFTTERSLKEHSLFHDKDLSQICGFPDCPKVFKLPQSLRMHLQTHRHSLESALFRKIKKPDKNISFQVQKKPSRIKAENKKDDNGLKFPIKESTQSEKPSLKCKLCGKCYAKEISLIRHKKRMHNEIQAGQHHCPYDDCGQSFLKKEKLEIHMCEHSPERRLFCEKCGQSFSCQRYLDVHHKIHLKNEAHASNPPTRSIPCEEEGCHKMFTTRENMKSHILNQHRGRKPCSRPGVFYPCTFPGCGRKFSFRSTLYRHKKLVHKGGDYKLGRQVVQYPCTHEGGCGKIFNRKNLLEEHLVMVHGKSSPQRLLPLRNKALDFTERVCTHCGMVLTQSLLPRHIELYHKTEPVRNLNENKSFPCHLEGCVEIFNTQEDRMEHVQSHIASPPYSCQVEGCTEVFYLEKNLDNHLWNHSREPSTCCYEGCTQTFDDQLELAKHSKVHYNGKIKCPWPNCDAWLTETGQLRPHFIAHSKAMHASDQSDYVCEVCQLAFSSRWGLMIHKRMHGEEAAAVVKPTLPRLAKFCCEEPGCPATFCDQKGFFDHFLYHFTKKSSVCDVDGCNQSFFNLITLAKHTKVHFDGKYQCPWQGCKKLFASPYIVKRHVYCHIVGKSRAAVSSDGGSLFNTSCATDKSREEDGEKQRKWPFPCTQCFMVFRLESNLKSHMEYHNEKSEYVCPICGKKGKHNHTKVPSVGNKPGKNHTCDQCGAKYATISGLKFHLLQKHKIGKWPFKCSYCDKGFVSSREMQRHMPSHTKEKPFVCNVCGASFASHTGHRAHMRKHTGQKYICEVEGCGKVYTTAVSLRGHMAQHAGFSKTCPFCGKTYKNPYGHKCKASREGKRKLLPDSNADANQETQQGSSSELPDTSLHELQPSDVGHQLQQPHQPHHYQNPQHQVLEVIHQQGTQFQPHHHQHHCQPQQHPQYGLPNGGAYPQTSEPFRPIIPGSVPQSSMLTPPGHSSIQQPQMIFMAPPQMLPGSGGSHSGMSFMAIPHNGSVPLHHHPQHHPHHPNMLHSLQPPPPPPPPQQPLSQTTSSNAARSLSHINLLNQGILTLPPHSSVLQMQQQRQQQQQHQTQQLLNSSGSSSLTAIGPEGVVSHHPHRASQGEPSSNNEHGDYVCNNYVVFWEGQM